MVLGPGRPKRFPRAAQDLVGPLAEDDEGLALNIRGVIEVDGPAARARELGQHLAVHDGVGAALVGRTASEGDVRGEVEWPGTQRHRHDRFGQCGREPAQ